MKNDKDDGSNIQYLPIFMCIGLSVGMAIGASLDRISIGMCIGMAIGVAVGALFDSNNRKSYDNTVQDDDPDKE